MAVYQGTRLRGAPLAVAADRTERPDPVPSRASSAPARVRPTGLLIAGIVASTILGMVYLTQTLGSNAATSEIAQLQSKQSELQITIGRHERFVLLSHDEDEVRAKAKRLGLKKLEAPLVLRAP